MSNFEIISKIGNGAYSTVYKVRRKKDKKIYALKKVKFINLTPREKQNTLNEVRLLASIKSPFVIGYKEAYVEKEDNNKFLCIVMEYADKGDLFQKINYLKKKKLKFQEIDVWKIFLQMTRGLKSLHDLKIIHRDLKSENIFLFSNGTAKIGDLNVSKVIKKELGCTQTGTPYYASPEVWSDKPYDTKSDIWSLACIIYEMLELKPPFRADDMEGLYKKVMKGKYDKINKRYSKDMSDLLDNLFKIEPKERPTCNEILKMPIVQKRIEFFKEQAGFDDDINNEDDNVLLQTIKVPQNILSLGDRLPKANYIIDCSVKKNDDLLNVNKSSEMVMTLPNINDSKILGNSNEKKLGNVIIKRNLSKEDYIKINLNDKFDNDKNVVMIKSKSPPQSHNIKIKRSGRSNKILMSGLQLYLKNNILKKASSNKRYLLPKIVNKNKKK